MNALKSFLAAFLILALSGCHEPPHPGTTSPIVLSASEMDQVFEEQGIYGTVLDADQLYAVPTVSWFEGAFLRDWRVFLGNLGGYQEESRDCDDFARGAAFYAQFLNSRTRANPKAALSVGEFWYQKAGPNGGGHAIVAALCRVDGTKNLVLRFMEPQTSQILNLTKEEYMSCYARRF